MKNQLGIFADLVEQYDAARPSYPTKAIDSVMASIGKTNPLILDLGCGTGISTRQLAKSGGFVIGCDPDPRMLEFALRHSQKNVAYAQGSASAIPFQTEQFDAVTAFTAFHWFTDAKSVREIKRVLKPLGVFCVIHSKHTSPHGNVLRKIIEEKIQQKTKNNYSDTNFEKCLEKAGFTCSRLPIVKQSIRYPLDTFMLLLKSYSVWNNVPEAMRPEMEKFLRRHFSAESKGGFIVDTRDLEILVARNR